GVDFESKPMLVFCACNFPSPKEVDYDKMLSMILYKLDEFVENDYTVVLFTSGATNRPGWTWLFKAYRSLSRKYKKNLKNLYVVHPSTWARVLMDMMNVVISPKFFKKLSWVDKLSDLAGLVPLDQISIPPAVQAYNDTIEPPRAVKDALNRRRQSSSGSSGSTVADGSTAMFGVPLTTLMGPNAEHGVPAVVRECIEYLQTHALETEGIFRRSPSSVDLKNAKAAYNRGEAVDLDKLGVHVAAVLLKMFFHELPTTALPSSLYEIAPALAQCTTDAEKTTFVQERIMATLDLPHRHILSHVFYLLHHIALYSSVNKMTSHNLAIVWTPNLVKSD
ncbi:Rho GTPase activation protein, partial [Dimargaris cristalligena]